MIEPLPFGCRQEGLLLKSQPTDFFFSLYEVKLLLILDINTQSKRFVQKKLILFKKVKTIEKLTNSL